MRAKPELYGKLLVFSDYDCAGISALHSGGDRQREVRCVYWCLNRFDEPIISAQLTFNFN